MLQEIENAREQLLRRTSASDHCVVTSHLATAGIALEDCLGALACVTEENADAAGRLAAIRARVAGVGEESDAFDRFILLHAALRALDRLEAEPLPSKVKRLCAELFFRWACTPPHMKWGDRFVAYAKLATLRRWPAGLFDFETSGVPRSLIPRIRPVRQLLRTLNVIGRPTRPFRPVLFAHLTVCRPVRAMFPADAQRSYYLMARTLELQPAVKGFVTVSWFHSPDTYRVSPHLSWLNDVFLTHGGVVATVGRADPACGVFNRSPERKEAYDRGWFTPTEGLVIWPRDQMIAWARQHPELEAA